MHKWKQSLSGVVMTRTEPDLINCPKPKLILLLRPLNISLLCGYVLYDIMKWGGVRIAVAIIFSTQLLPPKLSLMFFICITEYMYANYSDIYWCGRLFISTTAVTSSWIAADQRDCRL